MHTKADSVRSVLARRTPDRIVYAPNYWQWFAHQLNHGRLPPELTHCRTQLDLIRHLGLDVLSRNIYCNQQHCWFGGLSEEIWTGVDTREEIDFAGRDRVIKRTFVTPHGTLTERQRHVWEETTLVQEKFLLDDLAPELDAFAALVRGRRWRFCKDRFEAIRQEVGGDGVVNAGELFSPLKLLHLAAGADKAVFLLMDHPDWCREILAAHEEAQLDLVSQMLDAGVEAMMAMDNLDAMFHPPHYVERYSASFYEKASQLCRERGAVFFIHGCGHLRDLLPLIGGLGVDGLEGLAFPPLGNVELDEAMQLCGDRMIITGGISAAEFNRLTTRDAVFAYIRNLFDRMRPHAHRFMLSASCNTPYTAPWESIVWFRDAWREYSAVD